MPPVKGRRNMLPKRDRVICPNSLWQGLGPVLFVESVSSTSTTVLSFKQDKKHYCHDPLKLIVHM